MARSWLPSLFGDTSLTRPGADPFAQLQWEMNRLFEDMSRGFGLPVPSAGKAIATPRLNVSESEDAIRVEAELPGVAADDVHVELADNVLTIRGEKKAQQQSERENYHVVERSYGAFARSIPLPFAARPEEVNASFENGVLTVTVPKSAARENVHRIQVKGGGEATVRKIDRAAAGDKPGAEAPAQSATSGEQPPAPARQASEPENR